MTVQETRVRGRRSALAVPGDDPHKIAKALATGVDQIVLDLEDAVAVGRKDSARELVAGGQWWTRTSGVALAVRVNALSSPWGERDVLAVASSPAPIGAIVLPKTQSRAEIGRVEELIRASGAHRSIAVEALIETAAGVANLGDIVSDRDLLGALIIGYADLAASLGRRGDLPGVWRGIQDLVMVHGRAAGIDVIDGPYLGVADDDDFRDAVRLAADLGFDAKWVIHPRQIDTVNRVFTPTEEDIGAARRVVDALEAAQDVGRGAIQLDGELVDEAMAVAARRTLAKAER